MAVPSYLSASNESTVRAGKKQHLHDLSVRDVLGLKWSGFCQLSIACAGEHHEPLAAALFRVRQSHVAVGSAVGSAAGVTPGRSDFLEGAGSVWSAASPEELELQVVLSRWPQGSAFLQAAEATSLTSIGMVLTGVQNLYNTFKEDWSDLQDSLEQLRKELASQSLQMVVNLEIVLKQAAVLLGLLQGLPNFARCLQEALTDTRAARRQSQDVHGVAAVRASTFAGESFDTEGLLGVKLGSLLADARDMRKIVEDSELSQETKLDWCMGIRGSWVINGPDPCELLVRSFDSLEGWLSEWLDSGRPQVVFRELQIRQFAAAPNISRIEELSRLLHRTAECESAVRNLTADPELLETLQAVARLDEKEVEKEHSLLVEAVVTQFGPSEGLHAVDAEAELGRPGLLGLVRRAISAQWVFEMGLLAVASWGDRLKRRGNGLQNRLALVKSSLEHLHSQLRGLASFRRLAFEEIHSAGWWGRSGSGSSKEHTAQIASRLVQFLAHVQPGGVTSLLDVGCGWGEWVPEALEAAKRSGELPAGKFKYLGLDIAYQPIEHLRSKHRDNDLRFEVADGCLAARLRRGDGSSCLPAFESQGCLEAAVELVEGEAGLCGALLLARLAERGPGELRWLRWIWSSLAVSAAWDSTRLLQGHLKWESFVAVADASLREEAEMQSQRSLLQLKDHLAETAAQVWASASPGQLLQQMHEKAWPEGAELLEAAAAPLDLHKLGEVLVALRLRLDGLLAEWAEMQKALGDWRSEAERQARHLPINHGILLKQAQVLHQMLSLLPRFDQCLRSCIARVRRPADDYYSALLYLQGSPVAASQHRLKSVFTGEPNLLSSEEAEVAEVLALSQRLRLAQLDAGESVDSVDWCDGARELYAVGQGTDPCEALADTAASVLAEVHGWQASRAFLDRVRRFQFSTAPNISRLEALVGLLAEAGHCAVERTHDEVHFQLSAVGSACKTEVGIYFAIAAMTSGSSADTTWTFSGEMAAPAVGESTADDMVVQSVDSSTEDDKAKPSAVAKVVPKAKTSSRASTPSRPTSAGSKTTKASDRRSERPMLPVIQSLRWLSKGKDKGSRTPEQFPKPSSSRSSLTRSRTSTKVKKKSMVVAGRRTPPLEANSEEMVVEATPAMEDTSPIGFHSPGEDQDDQPLDTLRNQLEAARFAQQMFHQSEIQKYEGIVQTLVDKINEMSQEDEGSGLRIQELERQRDTACLAMQHMNQVKQKMMKDYEEAMTRMDEQSHAQRHHDQSIAEELAQQLQRLRS
eukprot:s3068_g3.t2